MHIEKEGEIYKIDVGRNRKATVTVGMEQPNRVIVNMPFELGSFDDWIECMHTVSEGLKKIRFDVQESIK